jgi:hypothetical protein
MAEARSRSQHNNGGKSKKPPSLTGSRYIPAYRFWGDDSTPSAGAGDGVPKVPSRLDLQNSNSPSPHSESGGRSLTWSNITREELPHQNVPDDASQNSDSSASSGRSDKPRRVDVEKVIEWALTKLDIDPDDSYKISAGIFFFKWLMLILKAFASAGVTFFAVKTLIGDYLKIMLFDLPHEVSHNRTACEIAQGDVNKHHLGDDPGMDSYLYFRFFTAWLGFCFSFASILLTRYSPVHLQTETLFGKTPKALQKEVDLASVVYYGNFIFLCTMVSALFSTNTSFLGSETITRALEEQNDKPYDRMLEIMGGFLGAIPALFVFFAFKVRGGSQNGRVMIRDLNNYHQRIKGKFLTENPDFNEESASGVNYCVQLAIALVRGIRPIALKGISLSMLMTIGYLLLADLSTTHALQRQACLFKDFVLDDRIARRISGYSLIFAAITCFSTNGLNTIKWVADSRSVLRALGKIEDKSKKRKVKAIMWIFAIDACFTLLGVGTGSYSRLEYWELTGIPAFVLSVIFASAFILGSYCFNYLPPLIEWIGKDVYNSSAIEDRPEGLDEIADDCSDDGIELVNQPEGPEADRLSLHSSPCASDDEGDVESQVRPNGIGLSFLGKDARMRAPGTVASSLGDNLLEEEGGRAARRGGFCSLM